MGIADSGFVYLRHPGSHVFPPTTASANNAVVECIARATPLLVNSLPPVVEYLGRDYPFYFDTLAEAAEKAQDRDLIARTHDYLTTCPARERLRGSSFLSELRQGEIYSGLPQIEARPMLW